MSSRRLSTAVSTRQSPTSAFRWRHDASAVACRYRLLVGELMKTWFVVVFALVACGREAPQSNQPVSVPNTGGENTAFTPNPPAFVIAPFTLSDGNGAFTMSADGQLSVTDVGTPLPKFSEDGTITLSGERIGTMSPDGTLRMAGNVVAVIAEDGGVTVAETRLSFAADGTINGAQGEPALVLAPADSEAKRLAMTVLLLMFSESAPPSSM